MNALPDDAVCYRTTEVFTAETLPAGLRKVHSTKAGVWGEVKLLAGTARFRFLPEGTEVALRAGDVVVAGPQHEHELLPGPGMQVQIAFWRRPA